MKHLLCAVFISIFLLSNGMALCAEPPETDISLPPEEEKTATYKVVEKIASGSERMRASINKTGVKTENAIERALDGTAKIILAIDGAAESIIARISGSETNRVIREKSQSTVDSIRTSPPAVIISDTTKKAYTGVGNALNLPTD